MWMSIKSKPLSSDSLKTMKQCDDEWDRIYGKREIAHGVKKNGKQKPRVDKRN